MKIEVSNNKKASRTHNYSSKISVLVIIAIILLIFIGRTLLAKRGGNPLDFFDIFNSITIVASLGLLIVPWRLIKKQDLAISILLGIFLGAEIRWAGFYPLIRVSNNLLVVSILHGLAFSIVFLSGIIIMRLGGPVKISLITVGWKKTLKSIGFGAFIGLPLAFFNSFALSMMNNRPYVVQRSILPLINALQPGIIEEVVYRFTFLGLLWLILDRSCPKHSAIMSGIIATIVHGYSHFSDLFYQRPIFTLAYGAAVCLIFGVPMMILAIKEDLETSIAFHWIQDAIRFMGGL